MNDGAGQLADDLTQFMDPGQVALFPAWETLPFERVSPAVETMGRRLEVLWRLRTPDRAPAVVVAGVRALLQHLGPGTDHLDPVVVRRGDVFDPDVLLERLVHFGYRREALVEHRGEVARRGAIIDIFPSTADAPVRIDLWGDEVDRLTEFSVNDQRSTRDLDEAMVFPARELVPDDGVRARAAALVADEPWGREQWERLAEGALFEGMESWLPWLVVLPLVVNAIVPLGELVPFPAGSPRSVLFTSLTTLGMSFYTFKLYASIKQGLKLQSLPFREVLTTTLFYPAFPMGPIDASQKFDHVALSRDPDVRRWVMGAGRIGMGAVKAFVIGEWIKTTASVAVFGVPMDAMYDRGWDGPVQALLFAFFSFGYLYVNFSGFTDVAIGAGWMFNLDLSENFRFPLIAHSIQNFWQRWHLSLAAFITRYMFKPMVRRTGRPVVSLIITFTLIGMWHEVSLGYLVWGLAHGSALGITLWWRTRRGTRPTLQIGRAHV